MSVLVFAESSEGKLVKASFEAVSYGAKLASDAGTELNVISFGGASDEEFNKLGNYGAGKIMVERNINEVQPFQMASIVEEAATRVGADTIIFSYDVTGKSVAPIVSAKMKAGLVAGVLDYPELSDGFVVKRAVFSGKAFARVKISSAVRIVGIMPNSVGAVEMTGSPAIEDFNGNVIGAKVTLKETRKEDLGGQVPLPEAELVVSAGRGLKGPENWGMVEDLASALGATTACSRPVSDLDWRPHHEHVGQTGLAIRPNLYIAIGISGAIQHLAGVNGSKVIVVINTDPEAPFFKAADYGIVGDAFEVVPKLVEAVKAFKASN
ncbi:electron transfer flavoprotein subunit alpha/FixB family protein [bacterium SCSIO 12643]|nr:electron transfer flavoprotein subunit alpha/FixB family protein [bacterium SCSIO 12643]